jgi:NitT/TauT family transport system ATP-binding protein
MSALTYDKQATLVKIEGVSVTLGGSPILRDVNAEVRDITRPGVKQGQVVGLLGPSGMGKTTLFRILAGLDKPDTGQVLLEEEAIPVQRGMVGVVAQNYPLFAYRTVWSNLVVAGMMERTTRAKVEERARDLLDRFGLKDHARKYPAQLSGGQRQRVAIAQQFMCSEHLLLMDEPFSGLDLLMQAEVCRFIREISLTDELQTIIIVTHDVESALEVCDTLWLLGRDRDARGNPIPGARIQKTFDLCERGLAWQEGISNTKEYMDLLREIREAFPKL